MAIEVQKDKISINQIVARKSENILIEGDQIVPDIKPDIMTAVNTNGTVCIYKKEVLDGKVKIDGCVQVYVMYMGDCGPDGQKLRCLNTVLDFSHTMNIDSAKAGMELNAKIGIKSLECKVLNGRKINVKGMLEIDINIISNENVEFIKGIDNIKDIQKINKKVGINSLVGSGNTKVLVKDTLMIDSIDNLAEIMKLDIQVTNKDNKISYNKILAKADARIKIMYSTEDGRTNMINSTLPVMGFIDIENISEDNICDVNHEIKNIVIKPNGVEEHSIYIEVEMDLHASIFERKEIEMIEDLYSPSMNLNFKQKNLQIMQNKEMIVKTHSIREKQKISELNNCRILDVEVMPKISNRNLKDNMIEYDGDVDLRFLYQDNESENINAVDFTVPYTHNMECRGLNPNSNIEDQIEVGMQDFTIMPDETIEMKIDINFMVNMFNHSNVRVVDEIVEEENREEEQFSMVIYFVKPGDTLWKIAKRFRSTVEMIARVNNIENTDVLQVGRQLFIPRYTMNTISEIA